MYYWSREEDSSAKIMHEFDIGSNGMVVGRKNFSCDICAAYYTRNPVQTGDLFNQL